MPPLAPFKGQYKESGKITYLRLRCATYPRARGQTRNLGKVFMLDHEVARYFRNLSFVRPLQQTANITSIPIMSLVSLLPRIIISSIFRNFGKSPLYLPYLLPSCVCAAPTMTCSERAASYSLAAADLAKEDERGARTMHFWGEKGRRDIDRLTLLSRCFPKSDKDVDVVVVA